MTAFWREFVQVKAVLTGAKQRRSADPVLSFNLYSIAYQFYKKKFGLNHEVKPLSVNGVAPTVENAKQGDIPYPGSCISMWTKESAPIT